MNGTRNRVQVRQTRFPVSLFAVVFGVLLLMSGIHVGLIVGMNKMNVGELLQVIVPMVYWILVAGGVTLYIRRQMKKTFEIPMQMLAKATNKVAHGDFSVFVPTINTPDKYDYLDTMILDFNTMVEELGGMETLKTDFFSNVSHEFKTPLAVIYNNAQLLEKEKGLEENQRECVQSILKAAKRLADLIMNMLKLNKLEKQTIKPKPESYDLCRQLCECALQFEDRWESQKIDFEADMEERVMVLADPGLLELVWTNLLSNAIKFTPAGGKVTLKEFSDDKGVTVIVEDTGCGMDETTKSHIFDKFYQGDTSHSTEGNGLGLALVNRILQLSDGDISVESALGKGSRFTVKLPLALASADDDLDEEEGL
ncbi:MAG: ATP-binding protein [Ruminococcus sp.]|jgi:signal transduction histidine kinase